MNRTRFALMIGALFAAAAAQAQTGAQTGAQASGQASVQANQQGANASASGAAATNATANTPQGSATLASGTAINAALNGSVDSKKAKVGDEVTAHTTEAVKEQGKTVLPKGTKLIGHVTQTSARANGDAQSALAMQFDKAILKHGEEVPMNLSLQALASAQTAAEIAGGGMDTMASPGAYGGASPGATAGGTRGAMGGVASTAGAATGTVANTAGRVGTAAGSTVNTTERTAVGATTGVNGAAGGLNSAGQLTAGSRGVFGLNGISLTTGASASQGSLITSTGKNVHLDGGTQMLLVTRAATSGSNDSGKSAAPKPDKPEPKAESKAQPNNQ